MPKISITIVNLHIIVGLITKVGTNLQEKASQAFGSQMMQIQ